MRVSAVAVFRRGDLLCEVVVAPGSSVRDVRDIVARRTRRVVERVESGHNGYAYIVTVAA